MIQLCVEPCVPTVPGPGRGRVAATGRHCVHIASQGRPSGASHPRADFAASQRRTHDILGRAIHSLGKYSSEELEANIHRALVLDRGSN